MMLVKKKLFTRAKWTFLRALKEINVTRIYIYVELKENLDNGCKRGANHSLIQRESTSCSMLAEHPINPSNVC